MTALLVVRATVPESDRAAFNAWYETEHLPEAKTAFKALSAKRGWSEQDPGIHIALYEFSSLAEANAVASSDQIKSLIAEFDRVWKHRVVRAREVVEIRQSI